MRSFRSRSREDSRLRRRIDSRPRGGRFASEAKGNRFADSPARRRYEERPRSHQRTRQRRKTASSSNSVSKSPVRKVSRGGGFDQNVILPEDIAVKAALQRMTAEQPPIQPLVQPPVNPIVERFLALNPVDPHAAVRLRALPPEQQAHVVSHSLAGARDPTAVLIGRIRKVAGWVQPESFPGRPIYTSPPNAPPPYMTMQPMQHTAQMKTIMAQTTSSAAREVEQNLKDKEATLKAAPNKKGDTQVESQRPDQQARDGDVSHAENRLCEKIESSTAPMNDILMPKDSISKGNTKVASVPYQRPFASKPRMTAAAEKQEIQAQLPEDPAIAKQRESYSRAQDLLQGAVSQSSSRAVTQELAAPMEPCPGSSSAQKHRPEGESSGPAHDIDTDWQKMGRVMNGPVVCDNKIPKGLQALKDKAVIQAGPTATIADLAGKNNASFDLPSGLLEVLAVQHQQQQQQLEKTQPNLAALLAQPPSQPSSGMPVSSEEAPLSEAEKAYQRAWLEHQMQAQMFLFEQQQALGLAIGPDNKQSAGGDAPKKGKGKGRGSNQPMLPGDWECPKCGDHQFSRNWTCRHCGALRPD